MRHLKFILIPLVWLWCAGICPAQTRIPEQARPPVALDADRAVEIALARSLRRSMALDDVEIARDRLAQAKSAFGPSLDLSGGLYRYNESPSLVQVNKGLVQLNNALSQLTMGQVPQEALPDDGRTYYGYSLELTQPLYTGNRLSAAKRMAEAGKDNAGHTLAIADNDLVLAVKNAYYTVLLTRQMALTMDAAVASMENHVREASEYHRMDTVSKLDVLRAKEKLADLKQQQLYAQNHFILAKAALNHVMGVDLKTVYTFNEKLAGRPLPGDLDRCQGQAVRQRPELKAMDAKIEMARGQFVFANSGRLPMVALKGGYHKYEPENDAPSADIGLVASISLYDHGRVKHKVAQARHQLEKAKTAKKLMLQSIDLEVEQAFHNALAALESIEVSRAALDTSRETLRAAQTRYKVGLSTSLERLDADVSLTRARTNHIRALSMYNISLSQLERAMGQGPGQLKEKEGLNK